MKKTSYLAVNDIVISDGTRARIVDLEVYCMDTFVSSYRGGWIDFFHSPGKHRLWRCLPGDPLWIPAWTASP